MKKTLETISSEIIVQVKQMLDNNNGSDFFDKKFILMYGETCFFINLTDIVITYRKMNLNRYITEEELKSNIKKIVDNLYSTNNRVKEEKILWKITPDEIFYAKLHIIKANASETFTVLVDTDIGSDQRVINIISDAGQEGISATNLNRITKSFLTKDERQAILTDLIKDEVIVLEFDQKNGRKKKVYKY